MNDADVLALLTARRQPLPPASPAPAAATPEPPADPPSNEDPEPPAEPPLETPAAGDEPPAEPSAEPSSDEAPPASKSVSPELQKRFDHLTGMNARLKDEVTELKTLLKEAVQSKAKNPAPAGDIQPFAHLQTAADVAAARQDLLKFRGWALRHPEGGEFNGQELTGDQVEQGLVQIETALDSQGTLNQRLLAIQQTEAATAAARQAHPWLGDETDQRTVAVERVLAQYPQLRVIPQHLDWAARIANSYAAEAKAKAAPAKPTAAAAPKRPAPEVPPRSVAPVTPAAADKVRGLYERFVQTGTDTDFDAWQAAKADAARAQKRK